MAFRLFAPLVKTARPSGSLFFHKRSAHNPGFQKYSARLGERLPSAGLAEIYPGTPSASTETQPTGPRTANITTLSNGIRVASISSTNPIASLGVYITAGSRSETRHDAGVTHFLKHLAFKSTTNRPAIQLTRDIEQLSATFSATAAREHILFEAQVLQDNATPLISILGDLLHPRVLYHEVERQKPWVEEEVSHLSADPATTLIEIVHREAFRNHGLGQPLVAPEYNIHHVSHEHIYSFVNAHYTTNNTVVVGVGLPHEELVEQVQQSFAGLTPSNAPTKPEPSKYVGGEASVPAGGNTHIALAFEGVASKSQKDGAALAVLQHLLGGGAQNTRDGPGVGLQSRLNLNVVAPNASVQSALTFNIPYSDTGLFGFYAEVSADVPKTIESLVSEIVSVLGEVDTTALTRAKQLLKTYILSASRSDVLHFVGEQAVGGASSIATPEQYAVSIDSISAEDVTRVARQVFSSAPTLVVLGDVSSVPSVDSIRETLTKKTK